MKLCLRHTTVIALVTVLLLACIPSLLAQDQSIESRTPATNCGWPEWYFQRAVNKPITAHIHLKSIDGDADGRLFRDSGGRTRRELAGRPTYIVDAALETEIALDESSKTATLTHFPPGSHPFGLHIQGISDECFELGTKKIDNIFATGIRSHIFQGGVWVAVGENWDSSTLNLALVIHHEDLFNSWTFTLTDVREIEPDASLFEIPAGYTVKEQWSTGGHRPPAVN